ncbi:DEAD/DEAH box helicase family protein [Pelagibius sp.]|uniref:DEAD/DEAH box helicase family protein n=1 Tax=Pelagibius sp. TaxID=1931238 RepID=UPI003B50AE31
MDAAADRPQTAFPRFRFTGTWRSYQARVLHELEDHLNDARLNIVAAPGAGKTVLGLEVLRRLGRPTLVLSPTRAIRDQWLQRLEELFEPENGPWPSGLGSDLSTPGWLTSTTYQALHAALRGLLEPGDEEDDEGEEVGEQEDNAAAATSGAAAGEALLAALEAAGIETLVLDEAHHLRRAWWESLQEVIGYLRARRKDFHVVSLTATPPYDVEQEEWNRYEEVCGPIDAEISIPELVKQGDLCPHQDFLHFNVARGAAFESLEAFAREAASVAGIWAQDPEVIGWIESHPWIADPQGHEARILARPAAFCGLLSVLKANRRPLPPAGPSVLCLNDEAVPAPSPRLFEELFQEILGGEAPFDSPDIAQRLKRDLQSIGALWRGRVRLRKQQDLVRALAGTAGKLDSIEAIARAEFAALGEGLRLVVLTDYVRAAALSRPADRSSDSLGAGPILRRLGQAGLAPELRPALMTGSWVVIPDEVTPALHAEAARLGFAEGEITLKPMRHIPGWSRVLVTSGKASRCLRVITHLFEDGHLRCLIGTAALLGEGWDAPSINSLVLATSVKSFMLSNQMRGRAIRISKRDPDKVSAIWHLATILPPFSDLSAGESSLWDLLSLQSQDPAARGRLDLNPFALGFDALAVFRRFKTFAGVSHFSPPVIESGIQRLGIETRKWDEEAARDWNRTMTARAADRGFVARAWAEVFFDKSAVERPAAGAVLPQPPGHQGLTRFGATWILAGLIGAALQVLVFTAEFLRHGLDTWLMIVGAGFLLVAAYHSGAILRTIRAGSPIRYLREIGRCVLDGLSRADALDKPRNALDVHVEESLDPGTRYCRLAGGGHHDEVAFADAMVTVFEPIANPRYLLIRYHRRGWLKQMDYHAVPDAIAADKAALEAFRRAWEKRIGRCELVNTRSREGRLILLRARTQAYSAGYLRKAERRLRWE